MKKNSSAKLTWTTRTKTTTEPHPRGNFCRRACINVFGPAYTNSVFVLLGSCCSMLKTYIYELEHAFRVRERRPPAASCFVTLPCGRWKRKDAESAPTCRSRVFVRRATAKAGDRYKKRGLFRRMCAGPFFALLNTAEKGAPRSSQNSGSRMRRSSFSEKQHLRYGFSAEKYLGSVIGYAAVGDRAAFCLFARVCRVGIYACFAASPDLRGCHLYVGGRAVEHFSGRP